MAEFPTTARVVIIGGGVVGVSSLYHLAKAGGPIACCWKRTS
jgi:dimethylglycine dehydrogenase